VCSKPDQGNDGNCQEITRNEISIGRHFVEAKTLRNP
jgi:hypothetical protein